MTTVRGDADTGRSGPALGAAFLAAQTLSLNAISLLTTAFIVRRLGSLHYGEWVTASSLASTHLVITNVGLRTLFVREIARRPGDAADLLANQLGLRLALGVVAAASAFTVCLLLGYPPIVMACMAVGALWIVLSVIGSTLGDLLQARERFGAYSAAGLAAGFAVTAASVVAVAAGSGPLGLTFAYLAQPIVSVSLLWREVSRQVPVQARWNWSEARKLLRNARVLGASSVATAAGDRAVLLLVPALVGLESFGVFSAGTIIADRLGAIPDAVATAFYPRVARAAVESSAAVEESTAAMLTVGMAACLPMAIASVYLAGPIAAILLPHDAVAGASVIRITVLGLPLLALATAMSYGLQAAGRHDTAARLGIGASMTTVVVSAVAVAMAGTGGASWALVARPAILAVALAHAFHGTFPGTLRRLPWLRMCVAAAALAATCQLIRHVEFLETLAAVIAGLAAYVAVLLVFRVFAISDLTGLVSRGARL
jgi:O-antigen/teichoic acid export membrane protein